MLIRQSDLTIELEALSTLTQAISEGGSENVFSDLRAQFGSGCARVSLRTKAWRSTPVSRRVTLRSTQGFVFVEPEDIVSIVLQWDLRREPLTVRDNDPVWRIITGETVMEVVRTEGRDEVVVGKIGVPVQGPSPAIGLPESHLPATPGCVLECVLGALFGSAFHQQFAQGTFSEWHELYRRRARAWLNWLSTAIDKAAVPAQAWHGQPAEDIYTTPLTRKTRPEPSLVRY